MARPTDPRSARRAAPSERDRYQPDPRRFDRYAERSSRDAPAPAGRRAGAARRRTSGGTRVTPFRVMLAVALVGALAFLGYALLVRDELQVPLLATGFLVLGLVLGAVAGSGGVATYRAAAEDRGGRAMALALVGGLAAVAAFGSLAAALIFAMLWRSG